MAGSGGAIDLAALALRIEAIGLSQANKALSELEGQGRRTGKSFEDFTDKTENASRGNTKLANVMRGVGLATAGVTGPLGKLGNTLLGFAPGGIWVGAAVLGLGLLSKAFEDSAKAAEDSSARIQKAIDASLPGKPGELSALAQRGVISDDVIGPLVARAEQLRKLFALGGRENDWMKTREGRDILNSIGQARQRMGALDTVGAAAREDTSAAAISNAMNLRVRAPGVQGMDAVAQGMLKFWRETNKELLKDGVKLAESFEDWGAATHDYLGEVMKGIELKHDAEKAEIELGMAEAEHARQARQAAAQMLVAGAQLIAGIISSLKNGDLWGGITGIGQSLLMLSLFTPLSPFVGAGIAAGGILGGAITSPSARPAPAGGAPTPMAPVIQNFTIIGERDPAAQAAVARMGRAGVIRGYGRT